MDKARHPHVIRTWRVERTKLPYRPPQGKLPAHPFFSPPRRADRNPTPPVAPPEKEG